MTHRELRAHRLPPSETARRAGVTVSTLHFYERKGLIESTRTSGNQRRYHRDVLRRIAFIKVAQHIGVSLGTIKDALDTLPRHSAPSKHDWTRLSRRWRADLDERIAKAQDLRDPIDGCIGCGCLSLESCTLYNPEDTLGTGAAGPARWARTRDP